MNARTLLLMTACLGRALALAPEPDDVAQRVAELTRGRSFAYVRQVGASTAGRPLVAVWLTQHPAQMESQLRVLVLCRQHGDESVPASAALLWLEEAVTRPAAFEHVAVLLLPTVNPDGAAAGRRPNGAGVDLNRDWTRRTQPETQAVEALFERWQPHLVIDLHTFNGRVHEDGTRADADWVEMFACGPSALDRVSWDLADEIVGGQRALGEHVELIRSTLASGIAPTLCHRHFALDHRCPAWLWEVGDARIDPQARMLSATLDLLDSRAEQLKPRLDDLRGLRDWRAPRDLAPRRTDSPPAVAAPHKPATPTTPPLPPVPLTVVAIGCGWLFLLRSKLCAEADD
jgi:hypothetical protein